MVQVYLGLAAGGRLWLRRLASPPAVTSHLLEPALLASEVMDIVKYVKECYVLCLDHFVIVDKCVVAAPLRWVSTVIHVDHLCRRQAPHATTAASAIASVPLIGLLCDLGYSIRFSAMKLVLFSCCYCVSVANWGVIGWCSVGCRGCSRVPSADNASSTAAKLPNSTHSPNSRKLLVLNNGQNHKL